MANILLHYKLLIFLLSSSLLKIFDISFWKEALCPLRISLLKLYDSWVKFNNTGKELSRQTAFWLDASIIILVSVALTKHLLTGNTQAPLWCRVKSAALPNFVNTILYNLVALCHDGLYESEHEHSAVALIGRCGRSTQTQYSILKKYKCML